MADETPLSFRSLVFYEVFVRNHGPEGRFSDVEADLRRIRSLGVDVVWLMPIHPVGEVNRKGRLGSPYSVRDYRAIDPAYGTEADFARLVEKTHRLGMKIILDMVFNHTAHDSALVADHRGWYDCGADGNPRPVSADWCDVAALRHPNRELYAYLIETLMRWVNLGVDGFRCDYASAVPLEFWIEARRVVASVKEDAIWLGESIHAAAVAGRRATGLIAHSDGEMYRAFDVLYDYDVWPIWQAAVQGEESVLRYLDMLRFQECIYPSNFVKLRCVENHDQLRIMKVAPTRRQAMAWTAFQAFNRGAFLIFAGQESATAHRPSLFDVDRVVWGKRPLEGFLRRLAHLKKDAALVDGKFVVTAGEPVIQATWQLGRSGLYGVFNVNGATGEVSVPLRDGMYRDVLRGGNHRVHGGETAIPRRAAILAFTGEYEFQPMPSCLFEYHPHEV